MIQIPKRITDNIDRFTGRTWLLPKILEWLDKSDQRLFLLTGGPGTGKSMIMAWLARYGPEPVTADAQQQLATLRAWVKAAHFCVADSGNTDPKEVARQIADHLTRTVPGFGKALAATLADQVRIESVLKDVTVQQGGTATGVYIGHLNLQGLSEELSFNRILRDPLQQLYKDGYDQPMLLLFDALDEALTYSGITNVVQLLAKFSDLPPQVRILASTRDEPRVLTFFHDIKPLDLIKDADPGTNDVFAYAQGRLAKLEAIDTSTCQSFAQRLSTQSNGIFLYAGLVLDELLTGLPSQLPNLDTYPLPKGLSGLYHSFLTRELGTEDTGRRWHRVYKPLLGLIAVAQGDGLTAEQLMTLIGQEVAEPLDACKQYLVGDLPDGPFKPFHKSFADFLFEDKKNVHYRIDPQSMHQRISQSFINKYSCHWQSCSSDYVLHYLPTHLLKTAGFQVAGSDYESTLQILVNLLSDFEFSYRKISLLGVDELIEDLRASQKVVLSSHATPLTELMSVLDPEASSLRWWRQNADLMARHPNFPAQQLYNRALQLEAIALATKAKAKLDELAAPYLAIGWWAKSDPCSPRPGTASQDRTKVHPVVLAMSYCDPYVALGHADATIELLELRSGKSAKRFSVPGKSIIMLATSQKGELIVVTSDGTFTFWEPQAWAVIRTITLPGEHKLRLTRITADGARALTISEENEIALWDLESRMRVRILAKDLSLQDVALSDDGRYAIGCEVDGAPWVWILEGEAPAHQLAMPELTSEQDSGFWWGLAVDLFDWAVKSLSGAAGTVTLSRKHGLAVSGHYESRLNSMVILWDLASGKSIHLLSCPGEVVRSVRMSDEGRYTITATTTWRLSGALRVFDTQSGNPLALIEVAAPIAQLAVSPDAHNLVVQDVKGDIYYLHLVNLSDMPV